MSRLAGAILAVRQAIVSATGRKLDEIGPEADIVEDLRLTLVQIECFELFIDDRFGVIVPDGFFRSPLYRTAESFAEWLIARSDEASWQERRA